MPRSNTSHNLDPQFSGVLQPLVDVLSRAPKRSGALAGQELALERDDIAAIIAIDADDNLHLLIAPALAEEHRFQRLDLRGLTITNCEWHVAGRPAQTYLDIACSTGELPAFRRPFLRFAEDVLYEMGAEARTPGDAVHRTCLRWKRFWSADASGQISTDWLHGLFGELVFLSTLIELYGPPVVRSWAGPLGRDHDFQAGTVIAVEVKTSTEMPMRIHANLRQLDTAIFLKLFLLCYRISKSEAGRTLPELVSEIERQLRGHDAELDRFYESLAAAKYERNLEPAYNESRFDRSEPMVYRVDESFPRLTETSFVTPPDHRISDIRYSLQITGIDASSLDDEADDIGLLASA
jgi:hypothetical protein